MKSEYQLLHFDAQRNVLKVEPVTPDLAAAEWIDDVFVRTRPCYTAYGAQLIGIKGSKYRVIETRYI